MGGFTFNKSTASVHFDLAHTRVNLGGWRYLLGDHVGQLRSLVIAGENGKATALEIQLLAGTSIASTISYLGDGLIYVGSMFGDSQVPKSSASLVNSLVFSRKEILFYFIIPSSVIANVI